MCLGWWGRGQVAVVLELLCLLHTDPPNDLYFPSPLCHGFYISLSCLCGGSKILVCFIVSFLFD